MFQTSSIGLILRKAPPAFQPARGIGVGGANVGTVPPGGGCGPATPIEFIPDHWDLDAGTYTIQDGDLLCQVAYFAGVQCTGGAGPCGQYGSYVHNINAVPGQSYDINHPEAIPVGTVVKLPPAAVANILALDCPPGWTRKAGSKNCVNVGVVPPGGNPPAKPPANMIGGNFGIYALGAAVLLGLGILIAENQKKKKAAPAHHAAHHLAHHR